MYLPIGICSEVSNRNNNMATDFGPDFEVNWPENWPKTVPKYSDFSINLLQQCANVKKPTPLTIAELKQNSENFSVPVTPLYTYRYNIMYICILE